MIQVICPWCRGTIKISDVIGSDLNVRLCPSCITVFRIASPTGTFFILEKSPNHTQVKTFL